MQNIAAGGEASCLILGDVRTMLSGRVDDSGLSAFLPGGFIAGLGTATPGPVEEIGELTVLGGRAYIRSPNAHQSTSSAVAPRTPFALLLPERAKPAAMAKPDGNSKEPLGRFCARMCEGRAAAFLGWLRLGQMHATALTHPNGNGEDMLRNPERMTLLEPRRDLYVFAFGVVADASARPGPDYDSTVEEKIFDQNPFEKAGSLPAGVRMHAHALMAEDGAGINAKAPEEMIKAISQWPASSTCHLLPQSVVKSGRLMIYPLRQFQQG